MYTKYIVYFNFIRLACARFFVPSRDAYETVPRTCIKVPGSAICWRKYSLNMRGTFNWY